MRRFLVLDMIYTSWISAETPLCQYFTWYWLIRLFPPATRWALSLVIKSEGFLWSSQFHNLNEAVSVKQRRSRPLSVSFSHSITINYASESRFPNTSVWLPRFKMNIRSVPPPSDQRGRIRPTGLPSLWSSVHVALGEMQVIVRYSVANWRQERGCHGWWKRTGAICHLDDLQSSLIHMCFQGNIISELQVEISRVSAWSSF